MQLRISRPCEISRRRWIDGARRCGRRGLGGEGERRRRLITRLGRLARGSDAPRLGEQPEHGGWRGVGALPLDEGDPRTDGRGEELPAAREAVRARVRVGVRVSVRPKVGASASVRAAVRVRPEEPPAAEPEVLQRVAGELAHLVDLVDGLARQQRGRPVLAGEGVARRDRGVPAHQQALTRYEVAVEPAEAHREEGRRAELRDGGEGREVRLPKARLRRVSSRLCGVC